MLPRIAGTAVILGVVLLLGVGCGATEGETPLGGWAVYQNEEYGFRIWHPNGWERYTSEGVAEEVEFSTAFRDPTVDDFQENILIMVPPYGDMSLSSLVDTLNTPLQSLGALVSDRDTTVNGEDGHEWILSWPSREGFTDAGQMQRLVVLSAKSGWYQLRCSALAQQYAAYEDTCDTMINSFRVD